MSSAPRKPSRCSPREQRELGDPARGFALKKATNLLREERSVDCLGLRSSSRRPWDRLPRGSGEMLYLGQLESKPEQRRRASRGSRRAQLRGEWHSTAYWLHLSVHTLSLLRTLSTVRPREEKVIPDSNHDRREFEVFRLV